MILVIEMIEKKIWECWRHLKKQQNCKEVNGRKKGGVKQWILWRKWYRILLLIGDRNEWN